MLHNIKKRKLDEIRNGYYKDKRNHTIVIKNDEHHKEWLKNYKNSKCVLSPNKAKYVKNINKDLIDIISNKIKDVKYITINKIKPYILMIFRNLIFVMMFSIIIENLKWLNIFETFSKDNNYQEHLIIMSLILMFLSLFNKRLFKTKKDLYNGFKNAITMSISIFLLGYYFGLTFY